MVNAFADVIAPAQASQKKFGIPASVTLAQWALESNWGRAMPPGSNNPFGIKAEDGQPFVECLTHEVIHGITKRVYAKFAKYPDLATAFLAHGRLFYNGHYRLALSELPNPEKFAEALTGVYATDPHYGLKLIGMMKKHDLYQYDKGEIA